MKKVLEKINDKDYYLIVAKYQNNDRMYIGICDEEDFLYDDITINLPDRDIEDINQVFISGNLQDKTKKLLEKKGIIKILDDTVQYNMGRYQVATVDLEKLKEYDNSGVEDFLKDKNKDSLVR